MNYIGSKQKLSNFILENIRRVVGQLEDKIFADIFAGSCVVAKALKPFVYKVIANDIEAFNFVLAQNYISNNQNTALVDEQIFVWLNQLEGIEGFIYQHYCLGSGSHRLYFSDTNGKKIDAMRQKIEEAYQNNTISSQSYYHLLASLLECVDSVANTASVYGAFLKKLKKTAQKDFILKPAPFVCTAQSNEVYQEDANTLIERIEGDILYLDPPYNARQYGANYHLLNTIALYDKFVPQGKTGLRPNYHKSAYCQRPKVAEALEDLIKKAKFKYIFMSYNNEGLLSLTQLSKLLQKYGHYDLITQNYQRFKADKTENRNYKTNNTIEYLHILEKM